MLRRSDALNVALIVMTWLAVFSKPLRMPWLQGADCYTRLFYLDRFVVTASNPWLPALQALILATSKISDSLWSYRVLTVTIGLAAMVMCWALVRLRYGAAAATFALAYFFMHRPWAVVTTSVYMEPVCVLFAASAGIAYVSGRRRLAAAFFVLATYARPEMLIAAPGLVIAVLWRTRSWRSTFRFGLLFVPVLGFYVYARFAFPHFATPTPSAETMLAVAKSLVSPIAKFWGWSVIALLAAAAVGRAWQRRAEEPERWRDVVTIVIVLAGYCAVYSIVIPFAQELRPPSTPRKGIASMMMITLLASTLAPELLRRTRWASPIAASLAIVLSLSTTPWWWSWERPDSTQRADRLRKALAGTPPPLCFCAVPDVDDPTSFLGTSVERQVLVQLRWAGREPRSIDCASVPSECGSLLTLVHGRPPQQCDHDEWIRQSDDHLCVKRLTALSIR